jgi:hypothetical protein
MHPPESSADDQALFLPASLGAPSPGCRVGSMRAVDSTPGECGPNATRSLQVRSEVGSRLDDLVDGSTVDVQQRSGDPRGSRRREIDSCERDVLWCPETS